MPAPSSYSRSKMPFTERAAEEEEPRGVYVATDPNIVGPVYAVKSSVNGTGEDLLRGARDAEHDHAEHDRAGRDRADELDVRAERGAVDDFDLLLVRSRDPREGGGRIGERHRAHAGTGTIVGRLQAQFVGTATQADVAAAVFAAETGDSKKVGTLP